MILRSPVLVLLVFPLAAQNRLALPDAVRTALEKHPSIEASAARAKAAETRIEQAKSGYLPKLNYTESWVRSNNPVFVFSSLLTQHQFSADNFAIGPLNRPDAMNNFQSQVTVDQVVWDPGQIRAGVRSAELGRSIAGEDERRARMNIVASVVRAYYGAVLAGESLKVAKEAVRSAEADQKRAEAVRQAGMATDADVLSIRVHLSAMREQEIRRSYDADIAQAALDEAVGLPLETRHELVTPLTPASLAEAVIADYEKSGVAERPEARQVQFAEKLAETQASAAKSSLLPQVGVRAAFEADRQRFIDRGGANWMLAASLKWNLFNGYADRARIAETSHALSGARAQRKQVDTGIRLEVRQAWANWKSAGERIQVASAAIDMAQESLRITKNRYESGLATVTDLLRNETALLEARTRRLAAVYDQRVAAVQLELAAGTLTGDSDALK